MLFLALVQVGPAQQAEQRDLKFERNTAHVSRRLALVIGNDKYRHFRPLLKAGNDASSMKAVLQECGFEVDLRLDASFRDMEVAINRFIDRLGPDDVALVYFAGHGIQIENENYLIPVDLTASDEADVKYGAYSASRLHDKVQATGVKLKIFILDACRNNPFRTARSLGNGGLAQMDSGVGSYIAFATAPGKVANESIKDANGVFTKYLLSSLKRPGLKLSQVFDEVRDSVYRESEGKQTPWSSTSVIGEFYFRPPLPVVEPKPPMREVIREIPKEVIREVPKEVVREVIREVPSNPAEVRRNRKDRQDYRWIPPATFEMGCDPNKQKCESDETPRHTVTLSHGFWIGITEVEVKSYDIYASEKKLKLPVGTQANPKWKYTDHPMTRVSWEEARDYCIWAGGRLPTEAEWEYAARGGTTTVDIDRGSVNASGRAGADKFDFTSPVKTFDPNGFGLYDMVGNVWEWVSDFYAEKIYAREAKVADPRGPESGIAHVSRGGGWYTGQKDLRLTIRGKRKEPSNEIGFRCVKDGWN